MHVIIPPKHMAEHRLLRHWKSHLQHTVRCMLCAHGRLTTPNHQLSTVPGDLGTETISEVFPECNLPHIPVRSEHYQITVATELRTHLIPRDMA